jgi:hypothetical protein
VTSWLNADQPGSSQERRIDQERVDQLLTLVQDASAAFVQALLGAGVGKVSTRPLSASRHAENSENSTE